MVKKGHIAHGKMILSSTPKGHSSWASTYTLGSIGMSNKETIIIMNGKVRLARLLTAWQIKELQSMTFMDEIKIKDTTNMKLLLEDNKDEVFS